MRILVGALIALAPAASAACPGRPLKQLIAQSLAGRDLEQATHQQLRSQLRWSNLLPRVRASAGVLDTSNNQVVVGQPQQRFRTMRWEVRVSWNLAALVYPRRRISVERLIDRRRVRRDRIVAKVVTLYFQRCRLLREVRATAEPKELSKRVQQLDRVRAQLWALTGRRGSWSIGHGQRTADSPPP